jgi:ribosomal protein S18 acetylase RimI-like enzyme
MSEMFSPTVVFNGHYTIRSLWIDFPDNRGNRLQLTVTDNETDCFCAAATVIDLNRESAGLCYLFVRGDFRKQGIGSALVDQVQIEAKRRGCKSLWLTVAKGNPARALYDKLGFIPAYHYEADGDLMMVKSI